MASKRQKSNDVIKRQLCKRVTNWEAAVECWVQARTDLSGVVVDDEALIPAIEVFVGVDLHAELLQHRLVGPLAHRVHGGAHVIEDAHDARRVLPSQGGRFTFAQTPSHQLPSR